MWYAPSRMRFLIICLLFAVACGTQTAHDKMIALLKEIEIRYNSPENSFSTDARLRYFDSLLAQSHTVSDSATATIYLARTLLESGNEQKAVTLLEQFAQQHATHQQYNRHGLMKNLALANLRLGERTNCIGLHAAESCIFPVAGRGIHYDKSGSMKAIALYESLLEKDPNDWETRWLLNIAYMTIGGYPDAVPAQWRLDNLHSDSDNTIKPFIDVSVQMGIDINNQAGGCVVDDFNNDGYLDIITSSWSLKEGMHYCRNNKDGSFGDASEVSKLGSIRGGLHIMQTDYNNDGWKDLFVMRGAWKGAFGLEPNSLLRNNGDGTFSDVTIESGLLSFHPTQTATWADFNNDGWLDVFIGNETANKDNTHPCELYLNNKNGTFTNVATQAACAITAFVKGVTSGDYNNDGWTDIFISTLDGKKILLQNDGLTNGDVHFTDVTEKAGLNKNISRTFSTWFWDYDNDGWPDILVCGYEFNRSLSWYAAAEAAGKLPDNGGHVYLFRNCHDGTFEEVTEKVGLNRVAFAMGSNFGDIDNDGYPDIYLGTGNPLYESLVPNKMFRNNNGVSFSDVTIASHTGNLQKGHGIAFADLDNDGDEDIYIDMGGAYRGDSYQNALYLNPGQNNNRYINITLEGVTCNKPAIGARIKTTFVEAGRERSVYRYVNSGSSFGGNPLRQHIGIGQASTISRIEITWPGSKEVQVLENIPSNQNIIIRQGQAGYQTVPLQSFTFGTTFAGCAPVR